MKFKEEIHNNEDDFLCNSCSNIEVLNSDKIHLCTSCEERICEQCYLEFEGYCKDCFTSLSKENEEEKMDLWKGFWSTRF